MQEFLSLALGYLIGIWRYRWLIVAIPAVIAPVGWFFVARMPDQFESSAEVFVDTDSVLKPILHGIAVRIDDDRRVAMMTKLLFSRDVIEKLARMTDLDLKAKTPQEKEKLIEGLQARVKLAGSKQNVYRLSYIDESADLSKRVVQAFLSIFVETNLGESRKDQANAEQFLVQEIKDYESRLVEMERKRKEFKAKNLGFISEGGGYYAQLQDTKTKLEQARLDKQIADERRNELQDQMVDLEAEEGGAGVFGGGTPAGNSPIDLQMRALQKQLDDLLVRYTDRHPDVMSARKAIARLEREKAATPPTAARRASGSGGMSTNPVYQQMRLLLSEAEAEVASRQAIVTEYERRIAQLQSAVDRLLEVETEDQQLNRDYELVNGKYKTLLERLEALRLGRQVDSTTDTVRFRVIEPPKVPDKPSGPNRVLFAAIVFGVTLAVGLGVAFILSLLRPTFINRKQLAEVTSVPVLGSVNMVWTQVQRHRHRLFNIAYAGSVALLLLTFGLVMAAFYLNVSVLPRVAGL